MQGEQVLDTVLPRDSRGTDWKLISEEKSDTKKMFSNPNYRRDYWDFYKEYVLPKLSPPATVQQQKSVTRRFIDGVASLVR